jgi:hypothetical protein
VLARHFIEWQSIRWRIAVFDGTTDDLEAIKALPPVGNYAV